MSLPPQNNYPQGDSLLIKHKQHVADYFDGEVKYWGNVYGENTGQAETYYHYSMNRRMMNVLKIIEEYSSGQPLRILDAGCGAGVMLVKLHLQGHSIYGIDISRKMVTEAHRLFRNNDYAGGRVFNGDIENLPFKDGSFDVVISVGVLQFLPDYEKCIKEYSRVVKNGGVIIVTFPNIFRFSNFFDPYYYIVRAAHYLIYLIGGGKTEDNISDPQSLSTNKYFTNRRYVYGNWEKHLKRYSLNDHVVYNVGYGPFTIWQKHVFSDNISIGISNTLDYLSMCKGFGWLKYFANRWVVSFQKGQSQ